MDGRESTHVIIGNVLGVVAAIYAINNLPPLFRGGLSVLDAITTLGSVAVIWWWLAWLIGSYRVRPRDTSDQASTSIETDELDSRPPPRSRPSADSAAEHRRSLGGMAWASRVAFRMLVIIAPLSMAAMIAVGMDLPMAHEAAAVLIGSFLFLSWLGAIHFIQQIVDEGLAQSLRWHAGLADPLCYRRHERATIRTGLASFLALFTAYVMYLAVAF